MLTKKTNLLTMVSLMLLVAISLVRPSQALAQNARLITGTVLSETENEPLIGVTIQVKGTAVGTSSSADGKYSIRAKSSDVLVFTYIGYKNKEVEVGTSTKIDVSLTEDASLLNEVIVIGYGTSEKPDLTGAVEVVKMDELMKAPVASFADALAGRVAGVQVAASDGQPGQAVNIVIRGAGSLTQDTSPLYVIDGFPVENPDPASLNPEDIESMTILKDASSTAIYGSRAANGVILIETKRGKVGKPVITYSGSIGFQDNRKQMEMLSPYEFVKYINELNPTDPTSRSYLAGDRTLESYRNVKGINWQDQVFGTGAVQIHNLALRGGNTDTRYALSGSVYDQKGVVENTGSSRYNGRITLDQNISKKLKAGITGSFSRVSSYGQPLAVSPGSVVSSYVLFRTFGYRPVVVGMAEEEFIDQDVDEDVVGTSDVRVNPFKDLQNQYQLNTTNQIVGNAFLTYEIMKGLSLKVVAGASMKSLESERFFNSKTTQGSPGNRGNVNGVHGYVRATNSNSWSNEYILNYKKTFNKTHTITALGLYGLNQYSTKVNGFSGRMLPNESLGIDGIDQGISYNPISYKTTSALMSYATRLDYNYKSKYIITGNFRADGSSKFSKNNRWGYFPGMAVAWNMHKENFFKEALPFIYASKLRVSYGTNGNNRVSDFARFASLEQTLDGYSFNNQTPTGAVYVSSVANEDLRWETVKQIDIGYEIAFLKNRIDLTVDVYRKTTNDLLLNALLPPTTGFGSAVKNIGSLKNEGIEFTLNTVNLSPKSALDWTSSFNISFNKNTILSLTRGQHALTTNASFDSFFNTPLYISEIGKSAGMMYGFVWDGNYQYEDFDMPAPGIYVLKNTVHTNGSERYSIKPGDIKYKDLNGDGVVDVYDKTIIGRGQPIHTGGFSNNVRYKGFSLNVFFQWSYGNNIYNANRLVFEGNSNSIRNLNQFASYANRWTPENPTNANYRTGGGGVVGMHSSRVVEDGSFLRLKTVSLDYAVPKRFTAKYINSLSFNVSSQNLYTWTNYSGLDPEVSVRNPVLSPGFDYSAYPQVQTLVLGVKASF